MADNYTYQTQQDAPLHNLQPEKPFKRTVEKVLTWIGIVLHAIWGLIIFSLGAIVDSREFRAQLIEQGYDPEQTVEAMGALSTTGVLFALIPFILALVAVFLFGKKVLAGILLILAAVTGVILSGSFIAALLWFIAAIMLFVRKPKNPQYVGVQQNNHTY